MVGKLDPCKVNNPLAHSHSAILQLSFFDAFNELAQNAHNDMASTLTKVRQIKQAGVYSQWLVEFTNQIKAHKLAMLLYMVQVSFLYNPLLLFTNYNAHLQYTLISFVEALFQKPCVEKLQLNSEISEIRSCALLGSEIEILLFPGFTRKKVLTSLDTRTAEISKDRPSILNSLSY